MNSSSKLFPLETVMTIDKEGGFTDPTNCWVSLDIDPERNHSEDVIETEQEPSKTHVHN